MILLGIIFNILQLLGSLIMPYPSLFGDMMIKTTGDDGIIRGDHELVITRIYRARIAKYIAMILSSKYDVATKTALSLERMI